MEAECVNMNKRSQKMKRILIMMICGLWTVCVKAQEVPLLQNVFAHLLKKGERKKASYVLEEWYKSK